MLLANALREPDDSVERDTIEQGAVFAYENLLVALAERDVEYVKK